MSDTHRNGSVVSFPADSRAGGSMQQHEAYDERPEVRLSPRVFPVATVVLALPFLFWIATIAFSPAGMQRFLAGLAGHIHWMTGSSDGNRVGAFVIFGVGVIAVFASIRAMIVRIYGLGTFGWIEFLSGFALLCGAAGEYHLNQIGFILALGMGWSAYILIVWGWQNIQNDQGPQGFAPQFQAQELPEQTVYGTARAALDEEIHAALRDKPPVANHGYRYKE